ncbi:VPLPA-CTERM sorting domain-containing protein [Aliiroseovarius sp. PTFE2010]|uniref:VPLPA-CTERM sorting domain-containing protein n=1 Tax=Aliiroseovarius sp. PTFE2010 TaxID=3417190 RepID=UPI003CF5CB29
MKKLHLMGAATAALLALSGTASASAIIASGDVMLGVDDFGQLNIGGGAADVAGETIVGMRFVDTASGDEYESTSHGCLCEGWGIAADGVGGDANNNSGGASGLSLVNFTSTATTATSVVDLIGSDLRITHEFTPSATASLYKVSVTLENTGASDIAAVTYRRAMDWDTSPTPFSEFVTIGGTATTTLLDESSDDGFADTNIIARPDLLDIGGCGEDVDFTACGPSDHGAAFDFALGSILAGEAYSFDIFYGGALGETAADAALGAVGAELYSYGWSADDADQDGFIDGTTDLAPTYIFAFAGVGGTVVVPPPGGGSAAVPLPAAGWLLIAGMGGLAAASRRKKA